MSQKKQNSNSHINTLATVFAIVLSLLFVFFKHSASAIDGPHGDARIRSQKGVCATCHIPHNAKGPKIWANQSNKPGQYDGIRKLCQTCHDGTMFYNGSGSIYSTQGYQGQDSDYGPPYKGEFKVDTQEDEQKAIYASTGIDDVLDDDMDDQYLSESEELKGPFENHVMHGGVNLNGHTLIIDIRNYPNVFPLDPTDKDNFPQEPADIKYRQGEPGFYCGTCHNPHKQPDERFTGGFYLRALEGQGVGDPWSNRKPFCKQCHGVIHAPESDCQECHHPHLGKTLIKDNETIGRKIFRYSIDDTIKFIAKPNVMNINETDNDKWKSALCYGCHNARAQNNWIKAGAVPIYGDDILPEENRKEHHPMGDQARLDDPAKILDEVFVRAPGTKELREKIPDLLNQNNELTCISCHDGFHGSGPYKNDPDSKGKSKRNNFLRWDFENDNPEFCTKCHSDKKDSFIGDHVVKIREDSKLSRTTYIADPNSNKVLPTDTGCTNCMFCHFIHDGKRDTNTDELTPDIDALMRVAPINLDWGERTKDKDSYDYEDLCFGCHTKDYIVGEQGTGGALLKTDLLFTHPFAVSPKITFDLVFPVSDGQEIAVPDDYGTETGYIYCGTCHDVHKGANQPYLRSDKSPYDPDGFCEACHDQDGFLNRSHPIDRGPNPDKINGPVTAEEFKDDLWGNGEIFSSGGSGKPGGITAPYNKVNSISISGTKGKVICLTCHNTHAAATASGSEAEPAHGKLLVMDNFPTDSVNTDGDELCRACHNRSLFPLNGPHRDELLGQSEIGICHNCHLPHPEKGKTGPKIWAVKLPGEFAGVHDLCYSCHNPSIPYTHSGQENVFITDPDKRYENHVMFGGAVIKAGNCPNATSLQLVGDLDTDYFPLDPNDFDTIPEKDNGTYCNSRSPFSYNKGGEGFYCGTCHNPHWDPEVALTDPNISGNYLRIKEGTSISKKGQFCVQCHGVYHAPGSDCMVCHHPHKGKTLIEEDEQIGRLILSLMALTPFTALPNVIEINDDPNNDNIPSGACYGCHNPQTEYEIKVIYGDDAGAQKKEHHPMGTQASITDPNKVMNNKFIRAPGTPIEHLNSNGEITCTSCHAGLHGLGPFTQYAERGKSMGNAFLRWELNNGMEKDKVDFCIECHTDKNKSDLNGKHLVSADENAYIKRGGCLFCHFVHDGDQRQTDLIPEVGIRPDVDSLMRIQSANLMWDDQGSIGEYDYEDLCFGCHSGEKNIVGGVGKAGAMLDSDAYFTHPFSLPADPNIISQGFTISDGLGMDVPDDYGAQKDYIYCGTCHDVHKGTNRPYLRTGQSPYEPYGLCEECHNKEGQFVSRSHPIGVRPNPDGAKGAPTYERFVDFYNNQADLFNAGGSGNPGGITHPYNEADASSSSTGQLICLTCHNTHAALTSWQGRSKTDTDQNHGYLLVKDNMEEKRGESPGSELCKACHPFGDLEYGFPSGDHGGGDLSGADLGICNVCHTPHYSIGPKLWTRQGYSIGPFTGTRQLCFTCHKPGGIGATGRGTVFKGAQIGGQVPEHYLEDHVMRSWADIDNVNFFDPNHYPLDPNDKDVIPACAPEYPINDGLYCGSCHNPHIQLGGDYLRSKEGNAGNSGLRKRFCIGCHTDRADHYEGKECLGCHHPHQGVTMICDDPNTGRLIYRREFERRAFLAKPNVDGFTGSDESSTCYGCHGPSMQDPNSQGWSELGATAIYGDLEEQARAKEAGWTPREHHPMGKQARFGQSLRALGADRSLFNRHGELTCTSCHSGSHKGERENNFLRWDFTKDNSHFCLRCHPNKQEPKLGPIGVAHHQTRETSPIKRVVNERVDTQAEGGCKEINVRCGNCMFCHFIHDGQDQGDTPTPAIEALMRVKPVNLRWADAWQDKDAQDYEDMCYGCHSQESIVGGPGGYGALLVSALDLLPEAATDPVLGHRFSHRFRCAPNPSSPTGVRLTAAGPFPISDGKGENVLGDYGSKAGHMYCGTCHDAHTWASNPGTKYLRGITSPYVAGGFCHECHSAEPAPSVCTPVINHRLAPAPVGSISVLEWSPLLYSNVDPSMPRGRGEKGGFVAVPAGLTPNLGQMTCLTCHNIHAAETTYDGHIDQPYSNETTIVDGRHGKLLIIDNGHGPAGSDLCINCHPEHSQIIGSAHDFSHRGLDGLGAGIADKGVCFACHRPHIALDENLLWARPMGEEKTMFGTVPGFALGTTIYCYDCHSGIWCDADPLPDLFLPFPPQDVAFMDGPGGIVAGYYEPLPAFVQDIPPHRIPSGMPTEVKTSGHYIRQPIITTGIAQNDKLACNDCHNPHRGMTKEGIPNQAFIKALLGGKIMGPYKASANMSYHKPIRDNLESRQACVACHGLADRPNAPVYPPAAFGEVNPLYTSILPVARPTKTVYDHFDIGVYPCTDCHRHNRAMVLCIDCHGYPPTTTGDGWSGPGDTDQNYMGGAGAHYTHVIEHQFSCTMCHIGCLHDPGGATVVTPVFKRAKVSIDFDLSYKFPRTSGEFQTRMGYYGPDGKLTIPPLYDPIKQTCYVGCHNPLVGDPDEIPNLDNPSPTWSLQPPQASTPPSFPSPSIPTWISVRTPYSVPVSLPGTWQIPWPGL